jgi:hypothetical protein
MSRVRIFALLVVLVLLTVSSALAETRGVAILLKRDKEKGTLVTIHSDVKEEKKTDIPLADAVKIVEKMQGWGSSVMVCIVADQNPKLGLSDGVPELPELRKLLKAVEENVWLSLVYLRIGDAKGGDDLVKHFIQATSGK